MGIRCSAKAVILSDDCILANQSVSDEGEIYYEFPGGGQNIFEDMETAVAREVLEETGYQIRVERLLAVAEEIYDDPAIREKYPDYTHRIFHIFLAKRVSDSRQTVLEKDFHQIGSVWVPIQEANQLNFRPAQIKGKITELVSWRDAAYLGAVHI